MDFGNINNNSSEGSMLLLGKKTGIDAKTVANTILYTTHPTKYTLPFFVCNRAKISGAGVASGAPSVNLGYNAPDYDNLIFMTYVGDNNNMYMRESSNTYDQLIPPNTDVYVSITSGGTVPGAETYEVDFYFFGIEV